MSRRTPQSPETERPPSSLDEPVLRAERNVVDACRAIIGGKKPITADDVHKLLEVIIYNVRIFNDFNGFTAPKDIVADVVRFICTDYMGIEWNKPSPVYERYRKRGEQLLRVLSSLDEAAGLM